MAGDGFAYGVQHFRAALADKIDTNRHPLAHLLNHGVNLLCQQGIYLLQSAAHGLDGRHPDAFGSDASGQNQRERLAGGERSGKELHLLDGEVAALALDRAPLAQDAYVPLDGGAAHPEFEFEPCNVPFPRLALDQLESLYESCELFLKGQNSHLLPKGSFYLTAAYSFLQ